MPVTCSMVYGIPTQRLMIITVALAHVLLVRNGSGLEIRPALVSRTLMAPWGCSMVRMIKRETNCGTAMESTKQKRQNALPCVSLRLMTMARIIPSR